MLNPRIFSHVPNSKLVPSVTLTTAKVVRVRSLVETNKREPSNHRAEMSGLARICWAFEPSMLLTQISTCGGVAPGTFCPYCTSHSRWLLSGLTLGGKPLVC